MANKVKVGDVVICTDKEHFHHYYLILSINERANGERACRFLHVRFNHDGTVHGSNYDTYRNELADYDFFEYRTIPAVDPIKINLVKMMSV